MIDKQSPPDAGSLLRTAARDRDFGFHVTASWRDVQAKAKRIRSEGGVVIVVASGDGVGGQVTGDHGTYEALLVYAPGTRKVADWTCGCKWAAYAWDRSPGYARFEGRKCSHALALQFEAQSQGMFGKEVAPSEPPKRVTTIVSYDPDTGQNILARPYEGSLVAAMVAQLRAADEDPSEIVGGLVRAGMRHTAAVALYKAAGDEKPSGPSVSGVALKAHDTGRVLMIQRGLEDEKDPARGKWEFPGGHHEDGDLTSLHAGIREFQEEVGQEFPANGAVKHTWTSPSGVYQGHVVVIPSEKDLSMKDGRVTVNPDDPKGDNHEQAAWWHPDDAKKNPALREELKTGTPWKEISKASLDGSKTAKTDWNEFRWVQDSQNRRAEQAGVAGGKSERDEYFGEGEHGGRGTERRITPKDWMTHSREQQFGELPPEEQEWHRGSDLGERHSEGLDDADFTEMDRAHGASPHPDHFYAGYVNGLHSGADVVHTASAWDPISNTNPQPGRGTSQPEHSDTTNPASTGWAASEDPDNWDNLNANPEPLTPSLGYDGALHAQPEPALPVTYGDDSQKPAEYHPEITPADLDPVPDNPPQSADLVPDQDGSISLLQGGSVTPNTFHSSLAPEAAGDRLAAIVAAFQQSAAGQELIAGPAPDEDISKAASAHLAKSKTALRDFDFAEQQELINEGASEGKRARNLGDLKIAGTHYALIEAELEREGIDATGLFI